MKDQLQAILNKHPDFKWTGNLGRRRSGEERFMLAAFTLYVGSPREDEARELYSIKAHPFVLQHELRRWLCERIGEAVVGDRPKFEIELLAQDVLDLDNLKVSA